jgi:large subunit ribosomal protein L29
MKNSEIKALSVAELKDKISAEKEGLRKLQFAHKISSIENPMRINSSLN